VIARLRAAGGIASLAHPGKLRRDELIQPMIADGLDALEVYHSDHSVGDVVRYQGLADRHGVMVTGGSDYHGPGSGRTTGLGEVGLPPAAFDRLVALAGRPR
jgi:predicted metal-dependent phosphoesterase TrpH